MRENMDQKNSEYGYFLRSETHATCNFHKHHESLYFIKMSDCGRCFEKKILGKRAKFLIVKMKSKITEIKSLTLSPK